MRKLIFYDVDGTLVDGPVHGVPASAAEALRLAHANGCLNIINTGRTLCNGEAQLDALPIDGWIMGCGARVLLQGETLLAREWTHAESCAIRETVRACGMHAVYEGDNGIWLEPEAPRQHPIIAGMSAFAERKGIARVIRAEDPDFRFVKLFTFDADGARVRRLLDALGGRFDAIRRPDTGDGWELVPAGCSKASGMDLICRRLGVPLSDCYALGDSANDLAMLTHVPNSIAMGNAPEEVRRVCAWVTAPPWEDGVFLALRHFGLI